MAPLSKLTLTSYRRTPPNRDPVKERRSKTLAALEQQKLVLAAALNGQEHIVTKPGWARDGDGNRQRIEKTHAVRPWFFQDAQGWVVQLKYGARVVPLEADNNAVIVQSLDDVAAGLFLNAALPFIGTPAVAQYGVQKVAICDVDGDWCAQILRNDSGFQSKYGLATYQ